MPSEQHDSCSHGEYGKSGKAFLTEADTLLVVTLGDSWSGQISAQQESRFGTMKALTASMGEKINAVKQVVLRPISDVLKEVAENAARAKNKA